MMTPKIAFGAHYRIMGTPENIQEHVRLVEARNIPVRSYTEFSVMDSEHGFIATGAADVATFDAKMATTKPAWDQLDQVYQERIRDLVAVTPVRKFWDKAYSAWRRYISERYNVTSPEWKEYQETHMPRYGQIYPARALNASMPQNLFDPMTGVLDPSVNPYM